MQPRLFLVASSLLLAGLAVLADPPSADDLASAVAGLADENPAVRAEARTTILRWGDKDPDAVEKALPADHKDAEARAQLQEIHELLKEKASVLHRKERVMAVIKDDAGLKAATEDLLERLADPAFLAPAQDSPVRLPETDGVLTPYVTANYDSGKPAMARVMEVLLVDGSLAVRRIAARILYYHGSAANEQALVAGMKDKDPYIRGACALTLSHYGVKTAVAAIKELLKDPDPQVQQHGQMALEEMGAAVEPDEMRKMLKSDDAGVRRRAVQMFVKQNDPDVLQDLAPLLNDPDAGVRTMVVDAMANLGGFQWDSEAARQRAAREWWEGRAKEGGAKGR